MRDAFFRNPWTLVGALALSFAGWLVLSARGGDAWPVAHADVLDAQFAGILSPAPSVGKGIRVGGILRRWHVDYTYEVDGQRFTGSDYSVTPQEPGSRLDVHYSPHDPSISVIEPGVDLMAVSGSLGLALIALVLRVLYPRRSQSAA